MARQVLPIVGAIVGAYFGNPQLGYAIGSIIGNAVDPQVIKGPALGEGQTNTAREGGWRPIVLGRGCVGCNIINVGPEIIRTHRDRQSKGGGPVSETKRRYRTFAMRICEGEVDLLRIWQGEKLVYDVRPESVIPAESAKYAEGFTFYRGDETQLPDPDIEAYMGVGDVNAYHGTSYIVFKHFDLTDSQGAIPNFRFEVASSSEVVIGNSFATINTSPGHIMTSATGIVWGGDIDTGLGEEIVLLRGLGGNLYAMGDGIGRVSQTGGSSWVDVVGVETGDGATITSMAYADGVWIITYDFGSIISRSTDGINFSPVNAGSASNHYESAANENTFVVAMNNSRCRVSVDRGLTWSIQTIRSGFTAPQALHFYSDRFFCLLGTDIASSATGLAGSWSFTDSPGASFVGVRFIGLGPTLMFSAGLDTWTSTDQAATWVPGGQYTGAISSGGQRNNITHNGLRFIVAVEQEIDTSEDGTVWVERAGGLGTSPVNVTSLAGEAVIAPDKIALSSIISFVHTRCGHTAGQYDVSELTDQVDGVVFADSYNGADAIRTILPIYFADASEYDAGSGYKINYIKRGKPVVRTITIDDLVDEPEEAVRQDSLERPAKLHVHFQSPTIGYAAAKATSGRTSPDVLVTGEVSIQVPITFADVDEVWKVANKLHKVSWVEVGGTQELVVADNNLDLAPADCIGLSLRGIVTRYRIVSQEYVDGTLKCEMLADRQSAYTSNVTGIPLPDPEPPPPSIVGPTISVFGDWPALADNHDALIAYAAATGQTPAWWGAVFQRSLDDGANYATAATFDSFNTIMGVLQADLPAASPHYTDTTNVLRVRLYTDDTIDSLTQKQFLSEGGAFALSWEDSGERHWEICQYRDAEQDSEGEWLLTTLLRGRLNTEAAEHLSGAIFVLLDNSLKVMGMQSAWLGLDLTHRAVSNGESPDAAVPYTDEFTGESQREWPVANLFGEIDGDDLDLSCVPRHRFGTDDAPVQSINHDGYRWTATDGVNNATADTATTTHTFDVTGWSTPITATVAQLNRITGAGPSISEEIE